VEVLSPSKTDAEMLRKFKAYETVTSIEWYLLVDSMEQRVWSYRRGEDGFVAEAEGPVIDSPFGAITVDQIYSDMGVPAPA
jgi:Uma2 family endonuclease